MIKRAEARGKVLPLKWVFVYKLNETGDLAKCKARICARGDLQEANFESTYAVTLAVRAFRTTMAIAARFDLEICQLDVVTAFLNGKIYPHKPVFVELPNGARILGMVAQLNRALYGLKDSPLLWYKEFSSTLEELGLQKSREEPCLFTND